MPQIEDRRVVPHSAERMYGLVADVERYPDFLPWCAALRVLSRRPGDDGETLDAEMMIAYRGLHERFTSRVTLRPQAHEIQVEYLDGPFLNLANQWRFEPLGPLACRVHFRLEYAFRSRVLGTLAGRVMGPVFERMADAFQARADALYAER
ncbi:MAG: type II toxin-antitoxin system RatA family toxin [Alphaproteobacteria bacterium]|nr:type II toxin-antitoxin system RatA family toxin [Alphaproteobacteria bacterium]